MTKKKESRVVKVGSPKEEMESMMPKTMARGKRMANMNYY
jgi:hypothetical protein